MEVKAHVLPLFNLKKMIKKYQYDREQNFVRIVIDCFGAKLPIEFKDGNCINGIKPSFYTNNEVFQRAIEDSDLYKLGNIILCDTIPEPGDKKKQEKFVPEGIKDAGEGQKSSPSGSSSDLEFDSVADAIMYIAEKYSESIETEAEARKFLKDRGFKVTIHKG
jgi:hypothetical protein